MSDAARASGADLEFNRLESQLDDLIRIVERLKEENRSLQQKQDALVTERAALLQKNELVRSRVEAMIARLRALEHSQ